jgi:hypothetical protein
VSPSDLENIAEELIYIVGTIILGIGVVRAAEIGRAFVGGIYRSRAFWLIVLMILAGFDNLASYVPALNGNGLSLSEVVFVLSFFVIYVFVDRNLLITMQIDFFHENTLRWRQFRRVGYVALGLGSLSLAIFSAAYNISNLTSPPVWALIVIFSYFGILAVILGYSSLALVKAARRTPDKTFRRFVRLLGITLAFAVLSATIWILPVVGNFVSTLCSAVACYGLYRCVMSLSPIGKVERIQV